MREFAKEIDVSFVKIEEVIGAGEALGFPSFTNVQNCKVQPSTFSKVVSFYNCYLAGVELPQ